MLAGKTLYFEADVHAIHKVELPDWDENLVKKVNANLTVSGLNKMMLESIDKSMSEKRKVQENHAINTALLAIAQFSHLPKNLLDAYSYQHYQRYISDLQQQVSTL